MPARPPAVSPPSHAAASWQAVCGFARVRRNTFGALCIAALLVPTQAYGDVTRFKASAYKHRVFTFRLAGVGPAGIQSARLRPGGRRVGVMKVRRAACGGKLRVRRAAFKPRPPKKLARRRLSRYRLILRRNGPQLFSPSSFWNAPLAPYATLDRQSPELSNVLRGEAEQEVAGGTGPWIETRAYTTPLYIVPCDQPTVRVELTDGSVGWRQSLQEALRAVPIPAGARPALGTDGHMTIWQPSTDKLWEFWQARRDPDGSWHANLGGAMQNVSQSPGYYTGDSWPGASFYWGATATRLPVIGGTIRLEELARGRIDHTLAMNIPQARAGVFSWPAQRTDGTLNSPVAIPEGARFRLDPGLDIAGLNLPPVVRMMAEAAQRYGIVVRDQTGAGKAIGFFVEDTTLGGPAADPFWDRGAPRADGYLQGTWPHALMARFPWGRLQLLEMNLCVSALGTCPWAR